MLILPLAGVGHDPLPMSVARLFGQVDLPIWTRRALAGDPKAAIVFATGLAPGRRSPAWLRTLSTA